MPARIIHFGDDHWHRVSVLQHAGVKVDVCRTAGELVSNLRTGTDPDAIVISQSRAVDPITAKSLARTVTLAPVILFPQHPHEPDAREFDMVVQPLTPPDDWLGDFWALIGQSRELHAQSEALWETSRQLRRESAAVRESSQKDRARRELEKQAEPEQDPWKRLT